MGSSIRTRADFLDYNEKQNVFFLNLENISFVSKNIRELKRLVHQQGEILKEMYTFFQNLYNGKEVLNLDDPIFCEVKHRVKKG